MTRTARRGVENKKRHDGSDWSELKPSPSQAAPQHASGSRPGSNSRPHGGGSNKFKGQKGKKDEAVLRTLLAKEQRREKRRLKREKERVSKKVCFKCRLPGHKVDECIMGEQGTGVCYRCGSTEHKAADCKSSKGSKDAMPFASCYVCGKQGHLARACPDNPRGLYPSGGGCRTCGSVEHFQRDCPEYLSKQGISSKMLTKISADASADAVEDDMDFGAASGNQHQQKTTNKKKKPKVIKF